MGQCSYISVVIHVSGTDSSGYLQLEIYDLQTPNNVNFPPATRDAPVEISLNPLITEITVHDYDEYAYEHPEIFLWLLTL